MTWSPNRLPFCDAEPTPIVPTTPTAWKDTPAGAVHRRRHASPERLDLVTQLMNGSMTFEGYARLLDRVEQEWQRHDTTATTGMTTRVD